MTNKDRLEFEVCQELGIPCIPPKLNPDDDRVWVYAVAKIITYDMRHSYAVVKNGVVGSPIILRTFTSGGCAMIESLHPYRHLNKEFLPKKKDNASIRSFIAKSYGVPQEEVDALPDDKIRNLMLNYSIEAQISKDKRMEDANRMVAQNKLEKLKRQEGINTDDDVDKIEEIIFED